jgi:hypothetical protein
MGCMLYFGLGINKNVIDEDNNKLIQKLHEYLIHEVHKIGRGIG